MCVYYNPTLLDGFGLKNYNYFDIMHNVLGIPRRCSICICRKTYELWQVKLMLSNSCIIKAGSSINATYLYLEGAQFEFRLLS
jgi:hypothetical protein